MKAVILLSGGLDSTVMLAIAVDQGRECHALSFDYGQRHLIELESAKAIAKHYSIAHKIVTIDRTFFASSVLVDKQKQVPTNRTAEQITTSGIPSTYVPARNTLFLAYALGYAEMVGAGEIWAGPNAMDVNAYPDCRPEFVAAFQSLMNVATKQAVEGSPQTLITPLIHWDKAEIIQQGMKLKAPLDMTFSCYDPQQGKIPCGRCDACVLRQKKS